MAQQIINAGTAINDGTGDSLRSGAIKINENFSELYSLPSIPQQTNQTGKFLSTNGSQLVWTTNDYTGPTLPSVSGNGTKFLTTDGTTTSWGFVNYTNLTNKPTIPTVPTYTITTAAASGSGSLSLTGSTFTFTPPNLSTYLTSVTTITGNAGTVTNGVYTTGSYSNPSWITALAYSKLSGAPSLATVATSGSYTDLTSKPTILNLQSRTTLSGATTSIAAGTSQTVTITGGFKGYALYSIQVSSAAWVTIYNGATARTSDASRLISTPASAGSGVLADVTTSGTYYFSPAVFGYNAENSTDIPLKVSNQGASPAIITVTLTLVRLEA